MKKLLARNAEADFGSIGIGAMIVFIAMILVAGVAASVIVGTSNTIQIQALTTGQQTTKEVASGLSVYGVSGEVNVTASTTYDLRYLAITVKARPGSDGIDLNNTFILVSDGTTKSLLSYNYVNASQAPNEDLSLGFQGYTFVGKSSAQGDLFGLLNTSAWSNVDRETFAIAVLQDYDSSITQYNPVLNRGDKAVLFLRCGGRPSANMSHMDYGLFSSEIAERTDVFGRVIPETGYPGVISFTAPMSYVDTVYTLQ